MEAPASFDDCLELAPPTRTGRKITLFMRQKATTAAVYAGDELISIAYFMPIGDEETQFYLHISKEAQPYLRQLIRIAHLTFARISQTNRVVSTIVRLGHKPGERLAQFTGFVPDPDTPEKWIWKVRDRNGRPNRWQTQTIGLSNRRRAQEPGGEPDRAGTPAATGK